jgi:AbrB family looped-hinge helix DNA binding protein
MAKDELRADVQVGAHGRLVIPAPLRRPLNLKPGEQLIARQVAEGLVLERRATVDPRK